MSANDYLYRIAVDYNTTDWQHNLRTYGEIEHMLSLFEEKYNHPERYPDPSTPIELWSKIETLRWVLKRIDNLDGHRV